MRSSFPEFYRPTPDDVQRFVTEGTVVIDTNVLLGLYSMTSVERDKVLDVFESIRDRLWIPYQVGLEYQRKRLDVVQRQASFYRRLVKLHGIRSADEYATILNGMTVPDEVKDEVRHLLAPMRDNLLEAAAEYVNTVVEITNKHIVTAEQANESDPVRERLDALFEGRVGERSEAATYAARVKEAGRRIAAQIPPGYMDHDKKDDEAKAGDFLLWSELLDHAEETAADCRPTLLVTNDTKEDWYRRSDRKAVGPRPELVREFGERSSNGYHQVPLDELLRLANAYLEANVDDATIDKASELSMLTADPSADEAMQRLAALGLLNTDPNDRHRLNVEYMTSVNDRIELLGRIKEMFPGRSVQDYDPETRSVVQMLTDPTHTLLSPDPKTRAASNSYLQTMLHRYREMEELLGVPYGGRPTGNLADD